MPEPTAKPERHINNIPVEKLRHRKPDRRDRTTKAYHDRVRSLAADFTIRGVLCALKVIRRPDHYEVVCGNTRLDSARMGGLAAVPCEVLDPNLTDLEITLIEATDNNSGEGFDYVALGGIVCDTMHTHGLTFGQVCARLPAVNKATLSKALSVFKNATDAVKAAMAANEIGPTAAYQLSRLPAADQDRLLDQAKLMAAEDLADAVNGVLHPDGMKKKKKPKPVKGRTRNGLEFVLPPDGDYATAKAEAAALVKAIAEAERQGLPLSVIPQLMRGPSPN